MYFNLADEGNKTIRVNLLLETTSATNTGMLQVKGVQVQPTGWLEVLEYYEYMGPQVEVRCATSIGIYKGLKILVSQTGFNINRASAT